MYVQVANEINNSQTPDSKKDKSLTPKTPKVPLSLEEIKAKMQASVDKVSFWKLQVCRPYFCTSTDQSNWMFLRNGYMSLIAVLLSEYVDVEAQKNENSFGTKRSLYS